MQSPFTHERPVGHAPSSHAQVALLGSHGGPPSAPPVPVVAPPVPVVAPPVPPLELVLVLLLDDELAPPLPPVPVAGRQP
jgi:hypothetical protein